MSPTNKPPVSGIARPAGGKKQFSLASLIMYVTLVAIICGMFTISVPAGVLLLITCVLALKVTLDIARERRQLRRQTTSKQKLLLFACGVASTSACGVATGVAFFTFCNSPGDDPQMDIFGQIGIGFGAIVGVIAGIFAFQAVARQHYDIH
jgi:hypothetical protein